MKDADGYWCHRDSITEEITYEWVPAAPCGWRVGWSLAEQDYCWICDASGEVLPEPPEEPKDDAMSYQDRLVLVRTLVAAALLPAKVSITEAILA